MASALLLTPLREAGHNFKTEVDPGAWRPIAGTLGELGRALDIDEAAKVDVVRSTPDPWAQARGFADAVLATGRDSPMVAQWRGLIALFALKERYADAYQLDLIPVPLAGSSTRFAEVMRQLLPVVALPFEPGDVDGGWDRPVIVRVFPVDGERRRTGQGTDVGLLNPASLVAGGRSLDTLTLPGVTWCQGGMKDPADATGAQGLSAPVLQTIAAFAERLSGQVASLCAGRGDDAAQRLVGTLRRRLDEFAQACRDPARHGGVDTRRYELVDGDRWADGLAPLYRLLTVPLRPKAATPGESECVLRLRDDLGGAAPVKGLVLLDDRIADALGRPANAISFWGTATLDDAARGGAGVRQGLREAIAADGYLMVTPDELFAPVLVRLDAPDRPARIPAHAESLSDCLLPLSPVALLLRTPEQLRAEVSLSRDNQVSLPLMLGQSPYVLTRRFVEQPGPGQGRLLDENDWSFGDVAIWPDYRSERWHHYAARIDYATNNPNWLRGRFAMSGALLANLLRDASDDPRRLAPWGDPAPLDGDASVLDRIDAYAGRTWNKPETGLTRFRASNSAGLASEIQLADVPFEATFFTIRPSADGAPVPAGLALLSVPAASAPHDNDAAVAIDFGTTNTVACLGDVAPIRLKARIIHPIQPARAGTAIAVGEMTQKFQNFLPVNDRLLPTPTVIIARSLDSAGRDALAAQGGIDDALLIRHLMYFQPDFADDGTIAAVPLSGWTTLLNSIRYNLKWDPTPEMRDASRRFLRQLMLMVACEWTQGGGDPAKLRWLFSRPEGMTDNDNKEFIDLLTRALNDVVPNTPPGALRQLIPEGKATARYILDEQSLNDGGSRGELNVILDIGGGTTDIAVWPNNAEKEALSVSVRLAGGDFFTDQILQNPEILNDFGLKTWTDVVQQLRGDADAGLKSKIHYIGELLFSGHTLKDAIERSWSRVSGTDNVRALKETSFLYLAGIAWFVGRQLRNKIEIDKTIDRATLSDIAVAFCGRGAGLFTRLHGSQARAKTEISRLMLLIGAAAGERQPPHPQVRVSPSPKIEVAAGMILMDKRDGPKLAVAPEDEADVLDFGSLDPAASTTATTPDAANPKALATGETGMEDLQPFLQAFAMVSGIRIELNDAQRAKLKNGIADVNADEKRAGRERPWEFVAALKVLVALMRLRPGDPARPTTSWKR